MAGGEDQPLLSAEQVERAREGQGWCTDLIGGAAIRGRETEVALGV